MSQIWLKGGEYLLWTRSDMTLTLDLENPFNDTANSLTIVTLRVKYEQYWNMGKNI